MRRNGRSPVDFIVRGIGRIRGIGDVERTILALSAAGRSPRSVGGRDLVRELVRKRRRNGSFAGLVNQTAFAILALRAAGRPAQRPHRPGGRRLAGLPAQRRRRLQLRRPRRAQRHRRHRRRAPGARRRRQAGHDGPSRRADAFLAARQNADGGLPLTPGADSNAQSTAWAIQGFVSAGRDPARVRRGGSVSPVAYLRSLQGSSGAVRYSRTATQSPVWVTSQALTALARRPFPIR